MCVIWSRYFCATSIAFRMLNLMDQPNTEHNPKFLDNNRRRPCCSCRFFWEALLSKTSFCCLRAAQIANQDSQCSYNCSEPWNTGRRTHMMRIQSQNDRSIESLQSQSCWFVLPALPSRWHFLLFGHLHLQMPCTSADFRPLNIKQFVTK